MKSNSKRGSSKTVRIWIVVAVIALIAAGGAAYYYFGVQPTLAEAQSPTVAPVQTAVARRGTISLSASGTGTLMPSQTVNLTFSTSGTVALINVKAGDQVKSGAVLAQLADLQSLQTGVSVAQANLISAQQALDTLKSGAAAALGNAQLAVATAQKAYTDAQSALKTKGLARCDATTTSAYYDKYMLAQQQLDALGTAPASSDIYLKTILPAKTKRDQAYSTYMFCAGFTDYEIASSQANLVITQANLKTAQDTLDKLTNNNGLDPDLLALAQNKVDNAQMAVTTAQQNLDGATLKAPLNATVVSVAGQVGDSVNSSTAFISLVDLAHPSVQFYIDETDMQKLALGNAVQVTFDALPNKTFSGKVTQIIPKLVTVSGYQAIQALATITLPADMASTTLPQGLNASVDVVSATAQNVVLVPVEAVRDLGEGQYAVFVMTNGKPLLRVVKVGLQDATSAEITSGLQAGEVVTTGIVGTK